ncbi:MAG: hypothetical protein V3S55_03945 [Nitrospiraceae bacterium]
MKCDVCGIRLVGGEPEDKTMPCLIAPRHFVDRSPLRPARVIAVIPGCPFEPERTPDFLPKTSLADISSQQRRDAAQQVEKTYEDAQDFRPTGHRKDHSIAFTAIE